MRDGEPSMRIRPGELAHDKQCLRILVSSTPSDSHTWNLIYLQLLIEELGHTVHNLGSCVPEELLVTECLSTRYDLAVISCVNGHGFTEGLGLIKSLRAHRELSAMPVVIGGKLGTDGLHNIYYTRQLHEAGFQRVFVDSDIDAFRCYVNELAAVRLAS